MSSKKTRKLAAKKGKKPDKVVVRAKSKESKKTPSLVSTRNRFKPAVPVFVVSKIKRVKKSTAIKQPPRFVQPKYIFEDIESFIPAKTKKKSPRTNQQLLDVLDTNQAKYQKKLRELKSRKDKKFDINDYENLVDWISDESKIEPSKEVIFELNDFKRDFPGDYKQWFPKIEIELKGRRLTERILGGVISPEDKEINDNLQKYEPSEQSKEIWKELGKKTGDQLLLMRDYCLAESLELHGQDSMDWWVLKDHIRYKDVKWLKFKKAAKKAGFSPAQIRTAWFSPKPRTRF